MGDVVKEEGRKRGESREHVGSKREKRGVEGGGGAGA